MKEGYKLFRVWWSGSDGRREIARILSRSMDNVVEFVKDEFVNEKLRDEIVELGDIDYVILEIAVCPVYEYNGSEDCEFCESAIECVTIEMVEDFDPEDIEFNLITGETLTWVETENGFEKLKDWNSILAKTVELLDTLHH